jgi:hypothetical protein
MSATASWRSGLAGPGIIAIALFAAVPVWGQSRTVPSLPGDGLPADADLATASWRPLLLPGPLAPGPSARTLSTTILDEAGHRIVLFGGVDDGTAFRDIWALPLDGTSDWTQLPVDVSNGPPPLRDHVSIYDPIRHRMLVFGGSGFDNTFSNDAWALSLDGPPAWSLLIPSGPRPSGRFSHAGAYDPVRDRFIVFGGYDGAFKNDVWALTLSATPSWTQLSPSGAAPRLDAMTAVYDRVRDRLLIFGGWDGFSFHNEVWSLSLAGAGSWSILGTSGTPPPPRRHYAAVYDVARDRLVISGGVDFNQELSDTWALDLSGTPTWSRVSAIPVPPARDGHRAVYDAAGNRMVIFGGYSMSTFNYFGDTWALSLIGTPTWSPVLSGPDLIPPRRDHLTVLDPSGDRLVVFGGWSGGPRNDVWQLSLGAHPAWSRIFAEGTPPTPRFVHTGIYDPVRQRLLVFGGYDGAFVNDVWALSLTGSPTWTEIHPTGPAPVGRDATTTIYDPVRDRMVFFGGWDGTQYLDDVWALSLSGEPSWERLDGDPQHGPSARRHHVAIYDPVIDCMVISGGFADEQLGDTWAFRLAHDDWSEIKGTPHQGPTPRNSHRAIFDPDHERLILFGGYDGHYKHDTWALSLGQPHRWVPLAMSGDLPSPRLLHTLTYDPVRKRALLVGGLDGAHELNDTWSLELGQAVGARETTTPEAGRSFASVARFAVHGITPNPASGSFAVEMTLPGDRPAAMTVFDVSGAVVQYTDLGSMPPGRHVVKVGRGARWAAGIYLVRIACGSEVRSIKAVVLH